ncbi:DUF418 domain-containing protein [Spirosoma agri]|uniref:DUF418 domain-containing protein n=1 Tax=Spirosoma agri TaxID=1987381 RepID=A0A6M0IM55_9BACT|nr:DUF418 domain-containing protein [Spirosoma agri]NEU68967.1 DUF418 domain-containing protein [Spirosoma agri]
MNSTIDLTRTARATEAEPGVRIQVVDALRGFALFGILLVHSAQWFAAGALPGDVYQLHASGPANGVAQTIVGLFFDGKFYTFFSFLFGLSFALMLTRSQDSPTVFYLRFAWRLVILGAIGFLHHLQWRGDILSIYALLGFLMLPFGKAANKFILTMALLLVMNIPTRLGSVYTELINPPDKAQPQADQKTVENDPKTYYNILKNGSYGDLVNFNLNAFDDKMRFQVESGRLYITLGFFLLGLYAGRKRLFQQLADNRSFFRKLTRYSGFTVLGITAIGAGLMVLYGNAQQPPKAIELLFMTLFDSHSALMTVFYISGLTLLFQRQSWNGVVSSLALVGKMALTSYVLQTLIGTFLFFSYGFHLLAEIDLWVAALLTIPIFIVQVLFSQWWLSRFRYGPLEWLWRSLTYGKAQSMLRRS